MAARRRETKQHAAPSGPLMKTKSYPKDLRIKKEAKTHRQPRRKTMAPTKLPTLKKMDNGIG